MTNVSMNCRDDNTSVTISNVPNIIKHFKVVTSLKSGDNFSQRLAPSGGGGACHKLPCCTWPRRNQTALSYTWIYA